MKPELEAAYRRCQQQARRAASNFYLSFYLLPRPKRRAMYALYSFLRRVDDAGDGPAGEAQWRLDNIRSAFGRMTAGQYDDPTLMALHDTITRYTIPGKHLAAALDGVQMDLDGRRYRTFDELADYCYHVASVVGLACIHIWGFDGEAAIEPAKACGIAFQLTNILRDLGEDAARGRVYLPAEDLARFGYSAEELRRGVRDERLERLIAFEVERAEQLYHESAPLAEHLHADGRRIFAAMSATYHALLHKIARAGGDVLTRRITVSRCKKLWLAGRAIFARRNGHAAAPAVEVARR